MLTYDIHTGKFSANIDDPNALKAGSTVTAAINDKGTIVGLYTDTGPTNGGAVVPPLSLIPLKVVEIAFGASSVMNVPVLVL